MEITLDGFREFLASVLIADSNWLNERALTDSEACKSRLQICLRLVGKHATHRLNIRALTSYSFGSQKNVAINFVQVKLI